jgi:hypothetical protein
MNRLTDGGLQMKRHTVLRFHHETIDTDKTRNGPASSILPRFTPPAYACILHRPAAAH